MGNPSMDYIPGLIAVALIASVSYAMGRVKGIWFQTQGREDAFRDGYAQATERMFSTAMKTQKNNSGKMTLPPEPVNYMGARHSVENRNMGTVRIKRVTR